VNILVAVLASLGIILAATYMLSLYRKIIFGRLVSSEAKRMSDLSKGEIYIFASLVFLILFFGFYPEPLFTTLDTSINNLVENYQLNLTYHLTENN
jgi:NADH-quinone oxidoreductase subunit M